jgi:hypothetical protein
MIFLTGTVCILQVEVVVERERERCVFILVPICGILWCATCTVYTLLGASVPLLSEKFRHFFLRNFSLHATCMLPS